MSYDDAVARQGEAFILMTLDFRLLEARRYLVAPSGRRLLECYDFTLEELTPEAVEEVRRAGR